MCKKWTQQQVRTDEQKENSGSSLDLLYNFLEEQVINMF